MHRFQVDASRTARALAAVAVLLVVANLAGQTSRHVFGHDYVKGLVPLFSLDGERNVPTFYSVLLLLLSSALLALLASLAWRSLPRRRARWAVLSGGFALMAYDEAFRVHEQLNRLHERLPEGLDWLYFAWVIPGVGLVLLLGLGLLRFLRDLDSRTMRAFALAGFLYLGGALGMEAVSGTYGYLNGFGNMRYALLVTVEEGLEMAGLIVFIHALLTHLATQYGNLNLAFVGGNRAVYASVLPVRQAGEEIARPLADELPPLVAGPRARIAPGTDDSYRH